MTSRPGDESLRRAGFRDEAGDSRVRTGVVLLAGPHSEISLDLAAQLVIRGGDFERGPDRFVYVRTPSCVRKSTLEPMAT